MAIKKSNVDMVNLLLSNKNIDVNLPHVTYKSDQIEFGYDEDKILIKKEILYIQI